MTPVPSKRRRCVELMCHTGRVRPNISSARAEELIRLTQEEAEVAIGEGNVPIACVVTDYGGKVLAQAHNTQNADSDPTAHAEINALRLLGSQMGTRYLDDLVIFSNAEICSMCASACIKAHIYSFYYGAPAETTMDPWLPLEEIAKVSRKPIHIVGPVLGEECASQIARGRTSLNGAI